MAAPKPATRFGVKIDIKTEELIPLKSPSAFGCRQSPPTLWRWAKKGLRSPVNGQVIKLATAYDGRFLCTSRQAYLRFLEQLNEPAQPIAAKRSRRKA